MFSNSVGDVPPRSIGGFVHDDTRFLSRWELTLNGRPLSLLKSGTVNYYSAALFITNETCPVCTRIASPGDAFGSSVRAFSSRSHSSTPLGSLTLPDPSRTARACGYVVGCRAIRPPGATRNTAAWKGEPWKTEPDSGATVTPSNNSSRGAKATSDPNLNRSKRCLLRTA